MTNKDPNLICQIEGCTRIVDIVKHMLCKGHLYRYYKFGDPGPSRIYTYRKRKPYKPNEQK